ncbi:DUF3270 family protein [Streptococcus vicugnae]|uniref:DUF3270 family protein n=1 Tax=Streptococcus vicugnae TaxID=2740579 RepID=A0A4R5G589_9STRE|nr:DUF3270 domain-containing protein [Streptococcus vicugnae]TDE71793.1 DUF3270 family protein [Streptococcus vicugnae]
MSTPLKQHKELEEQHLQENDTPKFYEFQEINHRSAKLKELMFFARIALFSVSTVVVSFFLLVLNLAPIWAFLFASLISLAITSAISSIIWSLRH